MGDMRHLLLVGGGHAQVEVLRQLSLTRLEGFVLRDAAPELPAQGAGA